MATFSGFEHIVHEQEPLARHTWLRLGGPAQYFAEPTSFEELAGLVARCEKEGLPVRLLGGGSNVLVRDEGVKGLVIHLAAPAFGEISVKGNTVTAGAGAKLAHVISTAVRDGLAGLEELVGIPGTVGGALHGNAGGHGADIGQFTVSAKVLTRSGEMFTRRREELHFGYRHSSLDELVILSAQFELESMSPADLVKRMQKLWIVKRAAQPQGDLSAGCMFKGPGGMSAAELIEQAGLKGARFGEAVVSETDANFIVAQTGATANDVLKLVQLVRQRVVEQLGVELELQMDVW